MDYSKDIFGEVEGSPETLANLGPLKPLAGMWVGDRGQDVHPVAEGSRQQKFTERMELRPIDFQTNGPQLLYGLRYHTHINTPGEKETFHDQVGYWLWEPATETVTLTLAIPRGLVAMATGKANAQAKSFTVKAERGSATNGILDNPFLAQAFKTIGFEMTVTIQDDGVWSYEQTTTLSIRGRSEPFPHTDRNTLRRVGPAQPNPLLGLARD